MTDNGVSGLSVVNWQRVRVKCSLSFVVMLSYCMVQHVAIQVNNGTDLFRTETNTTPPLYQKSCKPLEIIYNDTNVN